MKKSIPSKYKRHGLHIWCNECKKVVTKHPCAHTDKLKYQSRIWNPITKKQDCIKIHGEDKFEEAYESHLQFKASLKINNYNIPQAPPEKAKPVFLKEAAQMYLDYLEDFGLEDFEKKNLTKAYVGDQTRYITRFLKVVQRIHGKVSSFPLSSIDKSIVGAFVKDIQLQGLSDRSFNAHIGAVRYFVKHLIDEYNLEIENHFERVKQKSLSYDPTVVTIADFEKIVNSINPSNGIGQKGSNGHTVDYYRPWLKQAFLLSLLTGERLDGVVLLKWSHVDDNFLKIPNWKVNRIKQTDKYTSYTPITKDLAELLISLRIEDNPESYLIAPNYDNRETLKKFISKAFTHFKRVSGVKGNISFKNLRKSYITRIWELLGEKAGTIKHNNDKTAMRHYLDQKEIVSKVKNERLFNLSELL